MHVSTLALSHAHLLAPAICDAEEAAAHPHEAISVQVGACGAWSTTRGLTARQSSWQSVHSSCSLSSGWLEWPAALALRQPARHWTCCTALASWLLPSGACSSLSDAGARGAPASKGRVEMQTWRWQAAHLGYHSPAHRCQLHKCTLKAGRQAQLSRPRRSVHLPLDSICRCVPQARQSCCLLSQRQPDSGQ